MRYAILGLVLLLAGCAVRPNPGGIKDVQSAAVQLCRFLPAAETIANIFLAGNPLVSTTGQIAAAICNAVTTRPLADGPRVGPPTVNGVVVKGRFVR